MQLAMRSWLLLAACILACGAAPRGKAGHHRRHPHGRSASPKRPRAGVAQTPKATLLAHADLRNAAEEARRQAPANATEGQIVEKMQKLEKAIAARNTALRTGRIEVAGPLPVDFGERFAQAVAAATGCDPSQVNVVDTYPMDGASLLEIAAGAGPLASLLQTAVREDVMIVVFEAPSDVVSAVEAQAGEPDSKLANGALHEFLVAEDDDDDDASTSSPGSPVIPGKVDFDVDTELPYAELEPFGREDTAQELTSRSVLESDAMVDQLERAEVAEEKRAVFRALTRLRGAAITAYDGVARAQTGAIDEYSKTHQWRRTHPLHHLADEEADISRWAFPDNADF